MNDRLSPYCQEPPCMLTTTGQGGGVSGSYSSPNCEGAVP